MLKTFKVMKGFELVKREDHWGLYNEDGHKIAATIDGCYSKLSPKNCQAIERGYDLDELVVKVGKEFYVGGNYDFENGVKKGFLKAIELLGDKKFNEEDIAVAYDRGQILNIKGGQQSGKNYVKSLQQTEFDVEVEQELIQSSIEGEAIWKTKLDADGCLILRRI